MQRKKPEKVDIRSLDELAVIRIAELTGKEVRIDDSDGYIAVPEFCIYDIPYKIFEKLCKKGEIYGDLAILDSKTGRPLKYARTVRMKLRNN